MDLDIVSILPIDIFLYGNLLVAVLVVLLDSYSLSFVKLSDIDFNLSHKDLLALDIR